MVRNVVSKNSPVQQLQFDLKAMTRDDREAILDGTFGGKSSIVIPADQVLAMKADLSLTWRKLRDMRRYTYNNCNRVKKGDLHNYLY